MTKPQCKDCKHWSPSDPPIGECRRFAPRPTDARVIKWLLEIANQLRLSVASSDAEGDQSEESAEWFNETEQVTATEPSVSWQEVRADGWCGEFKPSPKPYAPEMPDETTSDIDVTTLKPWGEFIVPWGIAVLLRRAWAPQQIGDPPLAWFRQLGWDGFKRGLSEHPGDLRSREWVGRNLRCIWGIGFTKADAILTAMAERGWPFRD